LAGNRNLPGAEGPAGEATSATPYAKALFELARERAEAELVGRELDDGAAIFDVAELRDVLARPWIPPAVKRAVATEIAQRSKFSKLRADFLALVAGGGRTDYLKVIAEKYDKRLDEDLGRVRAHVRTAVPLTDKEREMLSAKLGKVLGSRQLVLEEIVDRGMLGGFLVESDSVVLDGSLEGQLDRMRRRLASHEDGAAARCAT
jgi:F-type H+-transporting ATPase subunit delta